MDTATAVARLVCLHARCEGIVATTVINDVIRDSPDLILMRIALAIGDSLAVPFPTDENSLRKIRHGTLQELVKQVQDLMAAKEKD